MSATPPRSFSSAPILPTDVLNLIWVLAADFALFGVIFGVSVAFSWPSARDLFLPWNGGARPIVRSVACRRQYQCKCGVKILLRPCRSAVRPFV